MLLIWHYPIGNLLGSLMNAKSLSAIFGPPFSFIILLVTALAGAILADFVGYWKREINLSEKITEPAIKN